MVGSDQEYQVNGKKILGRKTKWGTIEGNTHKSSHKYIHIGYAHTTIKGTAGYLSCQIGNGM